jgi:hypothetical protein
MLRLAHYMERRADHHTRRGDTIQADECLRVAAQWREMANA